MDDKINQIDETFIRDTVKEFMTQYKITPTQLGRVLGYKTKNASNLNSSANKFLNDPGRKITLEEVGLLAQYMRVPVMALLRPTEPSNSGIQSHGNGNHNILQHGSNSVASVNQSSSSDMEDLMAFMKLPHEERQTIIQYLNKTP